MAKQYKLTAARVAELEAEKEYLVTVKKKEVLDRIKEARSHGDLSENSEYDEARLEQGKLEGRLEELEEILSNYIIINEDIKNTDVVDIGVKVKVRDLEDDSEEIYRIVGTQEADPLHGSISDESPIGKALMGKKKGDEITVKAPGGEFKYVLVDILE